MKKIALACCAIPLALLAGSIDELENALEQTTQIATKTKLNIDFVPGTVTVITGKQLKSLGITNLAEQNAYDMIVGFDSSVLGLRGSGSIYGSQGNKIKWLINDKPFSSEIWGNGTYGVGPIAFPLPVDAIDRIEVIRGPGSAIYGGNAIYGVVNIITKKDENSIFSTISRTESDKYGKAIGALGHYKKEDLSINILASIYQNDGWNLNIGTNGNFYDWYNAQHTVGNAPGNLPNANSGEAVMLDANYKKYAIWLYRLKTNNNYAHIQWNPTIALAKDSSDTLQSNTFTSFGAQRDVELPQSVRLNAKLGYSSYDNIANAMYIWPASRLTGNTASADGVKDISYIEDKKYADVSLEKNIANHRLLGGTYLALTTVLKDKVVKNYSGIAYAPNTLDNFLGASNPKRFQNAFYIQDEIALSDETTVTAGVRQDSFSDTGGALSPRIALVYRYNDSNIFKVQASRAFRPPSMMEMYSSTLNGSEIKPETVDTVELGYIYKTSDTTLKTTIFKSFIKDMITFHDFSYDTMNLKYASILGLEVEASKKYSTFDIGANFGVYDTKKSETPPYALFFPAGLESSAFALSARFQGNAFLTLNPNTLYPTTFWYHYVGQKPRMNNSITINGAVYTSWTGYSMAKNGFTPPQDYLNITQKIKGLAKDFELDFGVKNAFGKTLHTLYMPLNPPNNKDIPYMRQTIWINANYKF